MRRSFILALLTSALVPALAVAAPLGVSSASDISARSGGLLGAFEASSEGVSEVAYAESITEPVTFVVGLDNFISNEEIEEPNDVPEPAALWMFGVGLALVASRLRRR